MRKVLTKGHTLRFDRFPDPWEVSVNAYERFWEVARPYLSAD